MFFSLCSPYKWPDASKYNLSQESRLIRILQGPNRSGIFHLGVRSQALFVFSCPTFKCFLWNTQRGHVWHCWSLKVRVRVIVTAGGNIQGPVLCKTLLNLSRKLESGGGSQQRDVFWRVWDDWSCKSVKLLGKKRIWKIWDPCHIDKQLKYTNLEAYLKTAQ